MTENFRIINERTCQLYEEIKDFTAMKYQTIAKLVDLLNTNKPWDSEDLQILQTEDLIKTIRKNIEHKIVLLFQHINAIKIEEFLLNSRISLWTKGQLVIGDALESIDPALFAVRVISALLSGYANAGSIIGSRDRFGTDLWQQFGVKYGVLIND